MRFWSLTWPWTQRPARTTARPSLPPAPAPAWPREVAANTALPFSIPAEDGREHATDVRRLVVIADTEVRVEELPITSCDLLIGLGDCTEESLLAIAAHLQHPPIVAVRGNHDPGWPLPHPIQDLHTRAVEIAGLRLGGLGGCLRYKANTSHQYDEEEYAAWCASLPPVDILLTHGPAAGIHDAPQSRTHRGSEAVRNYLRTHAPRLHLHGHMHRDLVTQLERTWVVGTYGFRIMDLAIPRR